MLDTVREVGPRLGVAPTCAALGVATASYYRRVKPKPATPPRPTPARALGRASGRPCSGSSRAALRGPGAHAGLRAPAHEGRYLCSPRTMYRLLAACREVRERRDQLRHPRYVAPQLLATRPNEVWSWDITKLLGPVKWTYFYLYVILDVFSRYVVGWMVAHRESAQLAAEAHRGDLRPAGHRARRAHPPRRPRLLDDVQAGGVAARDLGVTKTHSRPHVSNDNPFSEAQFKTLKYRPDFPERFGSIEDARGHCRVFFPWYNTEHRHGGIGLLTPHDVHYGLADQRVAARTDVLAAAYAAHPERFVAGLPRPPARSTEVWINRRRPRPHPQRIRLRRAARRTPARSEPRTASRRSREDRTYAPRINTFRSRGLRPRSRTRPTYQR